MLSTALLFSLSGMFFPSDMTFRIEWMNILTANDALLNDTEVTINTRICSCHFADNAFGKHPIHGYRFLLPTAIPSIFPLPVASGPILPGSLDNPDPDALLHSFASTNDLVDDESNLAATSGLGIFPNDDGSDVAGFDPVPTDVLLGTAEIVKANKPPKEIGIQYADGKYYFLQSEDESEDDLIEQSSTLGGESVKLPLLQNETHEEDDNSSQDAEGEADDAPFENQFEMVLSGDFDLKQEVEEMQQDEEDCDALFVEEAPTEVGTDSLIEEASMTNASEVVEAISPECILDEPLVGDTSPEVLEAEDDESIIENDIVTTYGPIEMLDESVATSRKDKRVDKHFCTYCNKGFQYESALKKHLLVHTGLKPHVCSDCGKSFSQKINLSVHRRMHTGEVAVKKYSCSVCNKKCIRLSELKTHMKSHWKKLPHVCTLCTERFADITNYYDHLKSEHKTEITTQESIDMIAQNENAELIVQGDDETLTDEDGMFRCTVCLKPFKTEKLLKKHKRKLHPKVFVCASCPKQFLYKSLLDKHARVHTQEKPFKCSHCDMSFSQKVNLEVHLGKKHNVHVRSAQPKLFICEYCTKSFDRPSTLQIHVRTHTKERPFCCRDCPKSFTSNSALATHIKANHRGESLLLHRHSAANDSVILEEQSATSEITEEDDDDDDVKFVQYSIQFVDNGEKEQT
ncbi:zinc finger protein 236-like isoform X2 [Armigeres subalbatus]|uniref:zinc finger protein 236-like isoform X2 n=1 Tax=Armigeres subalbatus TaxID=124917 RepID=UPI002ED1915B